MDPIFLQEWALREAGNASTEIDRCCRRTEFGHEMPMEKIRLLSGIEYALLQVAACSRAVARIEEDEAKGGVK